MMTFEEALNARFLLQKEYLGDDKPINRTTPLVSVSVATYQHKNYIRQCLDGILMQETDFPFEVIIGEDGSVDGTQEICMEYAEKYPDKIRLFIRDRALSQFKDADGTVKRFNGIWNRMSCRGEYIAMCEGDDYWIDPLKLQKQVDFMELHPDYGLCYSKAKTYIQKTSSYGRIIGNGKSTFEELLINNSIPTLTTMFRESLYHNYISEIGWHNEWRMGDYPIWLYCANKMKVHFIDEVMCVYRVLSNSASHGSYKFMMDFIVDSYKIALFYYDLYKPNIKLQLLHDSYHRELFSLSFHSKNKENINKYYQLIYYKSLKDYLKKFLAFVLIH